MKISNILKHRVVKNAGWIMGGRIVTMICSFIVSLLTARYLGPGNYGLINYGLAYTTFFYSICTLGINSVLVKCFVDDCGYTTVWDQFGKELKEQFGLPEIPLMYTASWLCNLKYGWNCTEASALEQVKKCQLPMLFIHGEKDDYVPTWMVYQLYEAKPQPKELWIVPNADHATSYKLNKETYTEKVKLFTDKYIQ